MLRRNLFYIYVVIAVAGLVVVSLSSVNKKSAIVALVESQKTAISYQKAVSVKSIHVIAGQQVRKGDLLLEVDRPDLNFDYEKLQNQKRQEESNLISLQSAYNSKLELINIESAGKINRIDAEIAQLESEIRLKQELQSNLNAMGSENRSKESVVDPDSILLNSYLTEKDQIGQHYNSERRRLKVGLTQDFDLVKLKVRLIEDEMSLLDKERSQLKKYAPFAGTIGNVNAQLDEIVPSFQTIVSLYELKPSMLKAFLGSDSPFILNPGDPVDVESANREYSVSGNVVEVGARIVSYKDPTEPLGAPQRFGREVFISLPNDNNFLYGEQVFVYPRNN